MRVFIPNLNKGGIGGGPTFLQNFLNGMPKDYIFMPEIDGADIMFVPNPMWAERKDFTDAQDRNIPIVLRLDNIPEDWNNRGTSISKLTDFTAWADHIVYQSEWSRQKYLEFGAKDGAVIRNGVDTNLFTPGEKSDRVEILFVKSGRNENKRYPEGMEIFRRYWQKNKNSHLTLVGQFADDFHKYNFGFYNGENFSYIGMGVLQGMPEVYRGANVLLFPAYADCAPNVVLEAMSCGVVPVIHPYGGGAEFLDNWRYGINLNDYQTDYESMINAALAIKPEEVRDYVSQMFNLQTMCKNYQEVFDGLKI